MSVIDDKQMSDTIVEDLMCNYNYSKKEALEWVIEHGENIVNGMWDEYSFYMSENAIYTEEKS